MVLVFSGLKLTVIVDDENNTVRFDTMNKRGEGLAV